MEKICSLQNFISFFAIFAVIFVDNLGVVKFSLKKIAFLCAFAVHAQLSTGVDISCISAFLYRKGIFMLSERLEMILRNVKGDSIADIGTDHAFVPIALAQTGKRVIATDANSGPLLSAKKNVEKYSLDISLRLGNGLAPLSFGEVGEIIIAGMGGELIKTIISNDLEKARHSRLILQPMNSQAELRQFLTENGFKITAEDLAKEDRKIYNLIVAEAGKTRVAASGTDLHLPPILYSHPLFPMLLAKKEREFTKQFNGLSKSGDADPGELARLEKLLCDIEKLKKEVIK